MAALRGYMVDEIPTERMFRRAAETCPGGMSLTIGDDAKEPERIACSSSVYRSEATVLLLGFIYIGFVVADSL